MRGGQRKAEPVTQAAVLPGPAGTGGILPGLGHCTWWLQLAQPQPGAWHLSGGSAVPGDTARPCSVTCLQAYSAAQTLRRLPSRGSSRSHHQTRFVGGSGLVRASLVPRNSG